MAKPSFKEWLYDHQAFIRRPEFIEAKMALPDLNELSLEMGPNCNLHCPHCNVECGPDRIGLPDLGTTVKLLDEACRLRMKSVTLTCGEPLRDENKAVVGAVSAFSKFLVTEVITNGVFAHSFDNAVKWFEFMKERGLDFSKRGRLSVSVGSTYFVPLRNYANLNRALMAVYPRADWGQFLIYRHLNVLDNEANKRLIYQMGDVFEETFGSKKESDLGWGPRREPLINIYPRKGGRSIRFVSYQCVSRGRAKNFDWSTRESEKLREIKPQDITSVDCQEGQGVEAGFDGNITFTDCREMYRDRRYGNVVSDPLSVILDRIRADSFFQGFKLGGVSLLYYAARQVRPGLTIVGRRGSDVLRVIRGDTEIAEEVRQYLEKKGVVNTYNQLMATIDFRRKQRVGL
jgi:hypothetical protein